MAGVRSSTPNHPLNTTLRMDGPVVELLSAQGRSDLSLWRQSLPGNVKKVFDSLSKTFVFLLSGNPSTAVRLTAPPDPNQHLGLVHGIVVVQLKVPESRDFSLECTVRDDASSRRRIQFSTFFREVQVTPDTARIPISALQKGKWCNLCIPVADLIRTLWPGRVLVQVDGLTVCANCSLQKILALKDKEKNGSVCLPPSCQMRTDLQAVTQIFSWNLISSQTSKKSRSPDIGLRKKDQRDWESTEEFHLRAEGVGLFQLQPISSRVSERGGRRRGEVASAPTEIIPRIRDRTPPPRRRPASSGSTRPSVRRSSSLPRIENASLFPFHKETLLNGVKDYARKPPEKPPVIPRQAWRGSSALHHNRAARLKAQSDRLQETHPEPVSEDHSDSGPDSAPVVINGDGTADSSLSSIDYVLSQRLAEAIYGPDETVHYSDSDAEPEGFHSPPLPVSGSPSLPLGEDVPPPAASISPFGNYPQSILKTSSNYRRNERGAGRSQSFAGDRSTIISGQTPTELGESQIPEEDLSPTPERVVAELPKPTLDVEEAAVLESMRRSNLDLSWMRSEGGGMASSSGGEGWRRTVLDGSMGLRRHEFDDEDSESESGSSIGPMNVRGSTPGAGQDMSLFSLEASGTQSILSSRLQSNIGVSDSGEEYAGERSGVPSGMEGEDPGSFQVQESNGTGLSDVANCPVMNLMFDPELNCYYHPDTKKYYQVASY